MESRRDFLEWLGPDASTSVLMRLDDPVDLVRASSVARSWQKFVIANGFCKKLCLKMCPEVSIFACTIEVRSSVHTEKIESAALMEWANLEREHWAYAFLGHCFISPMEKRDCIVKSLCASSTDNYPEEGIGNTLVPSEQLNTGPSYWSSKGESDPEVPETLTYKLRSRLCIVNKIKIRPFKAFFQYGYPIYSAKYVRFRMGYLRLPADEKSQEQINDEYIWTYVSPQFPMVQENVLQTFEFPKPVICIGGIVQIELLGRVQKQEMDGLYYICVCHVRVIGSPLSPVFDVDILPTTGEHILEYFPGTRTSSPIRESNEGGARESGWNTLVARVRQLRRRAWNRAILNLLRPVADEDPFA